MQPSGSPPPRPHVPPHLYENRFLVVLAVLLVVSVTVTFGFLFYLVPRITDGGTQKPVVTFFAPTLSNGNATVGVAGASPPMNPARFEVNLAALSGGFAYIGTATTMPTTTGGWVTLNVGPECCRVYWTDTSGSGNLTHYSVFTITGINVKLTGATRYGFVLIWSEDGTELTSVTFVTP